MPAGARPEIRAKGLDAPQRPDRLHFSAPTVDGEGGVVEGDFSNGDAGAASEADGLTRAERRKAQKNGAAGAAARSSARSLRLPAALRRGFVLQGGWGRAPRGVRPQPLS